MAMDPPIWNMNERREVLREYRKRYGLNVLIETGTHEGGTPWALQDEFRQIFTIELDDGLFARAEAMFRLISNVECVHGNSKEELAGVLARIEEPALVWCDGHHSGPGTAYGPESTPIRDELRVLFADGRPHVILVDDARCFDGGYEHNLYEHYATYPSLDWIRTFANEHGYNYLLADDIIRLTPAA